MSQDTQNRRAFVRGAGVALAALAGCVGGRGGENDATPRAGRATTAPRTGTEPPPASTESATETRTPATAADHPWFIPRGETLDDFETFADDWTAERGEATITDDAFAGESAVAVDTAGESRARLVREFVVPRDFTGRGLSVAANLRSTTKPLVQVSLVLEDSDGNRRYHSGSIQPTATDAWLRLDAGVVSDEGLDPSSVSALWVEHYAGDAETSFVVDDVRTVERPDRGTVVIAFSNEGPADYGVAADVLSSYGYAGVCYPTLDTLGEAPTPAAAEFRELVDAGWDIGGHTGSHERLSDHSKAEQRRSLAENAAKLRTLGLADGPLHFRTPYGKYDANTLDVVLESFDTCVVGAGWATGTNLALTDPRTVGFASGNDLADATEYVEAAADYGQLLGLNVRMEDADRAHVEALVEAVHARVEGGDLEVLTMTDVHGRSLRR